MNGARLHSQVNKYRVWVNGVLFPSVIYSTVDDFQLLLPHPSRNYGFSDVWENFRLDEGWNHLLFQLDTTMKPKSTRFRFGVPKGVEGVVSSADPPADHGKPSTDALQPYVAEALALGPFPGIPDRGVYVRLSEDEDPNHVPMDMAARGELVTIDADFVRFRGFEVRHGGQFQQRAQVKVHGEGVWIEGCLIRDSEVRGITVQCDKDLTAAPVVLRNNWIINPGNTGIGMAGASDVITAENQNQNAPGRSPVWIEYNTIVNHNWAGFPPLWESGGMKLMRSSGCVIRYNTIVGGSGPGIWLDWEHFNNRIEGNLFRNVWAFGVGVEASPGPTLIANNVCTNLRPGPVWFRWALLSWSSDRNYVVHNTIDGRWISAPAWQNKTGTDGIYLNEGGDDRHTRWVPLDQRRQFVFNNVIVGCRVAVRRKPGDLVEANFTDRGQGARPLDAGAWFHSPDTEDYRPATGSPLCGAGGMNDTTRLVRHDFFGLPRAHADRPAVGAFRCGAPLDEPGITTLEIELKDHTVVYRRFPSD